MWVRVWVRGSGCWEGASGCTRAQLTMALSMASGWSGVLAASAVFVRATARTTSFCFGRSDNDLGSKVMKGGGGVEIADLDRAGQEALTAQSRARRPGDRPDARAPWQGGGRPRRCLRRR